MRSALALVATGAVFGALLMRASTSSRRVQEPPRNAFVLCVTLQFKSERARDAFKSLFAGFAAWVRANEPATLSYDVLQSDKDALKVTIVERYATRGDYADVHRTSDEFLAFRAQLKSMEADYTMTGDSYLASDLGFV